MFYLEREKKNLKITNNEYLLFYFIFHLFLIYRPHNLYNGENVTEKNYNLLKAIKNSPKQSVLIGDFNYSDIDWKNRTASAKISKDFLELVEDKFLKMEQKETNQSNNYIQL